MNERARTKRTLLILVGVAAMGCFASGPISGIAGKPSPNFPATRAQQPLNVAIDVRGVPSKETCSRTSGSRDVCLSGLDSAFYEGFSPVINRFFVHNQKSAEFVSRVDMVEFFVEPAAMNGQGGAVALRLGMRWRFTLSDDKGHTLAQLADTTICPRALAGEDDLQPVSRMLVESIVEQVAQGINRLPEAKDSAKPDPKSATTTEL